MMLTDWLGHGVVVEGKTFFAIDFKIFQSDKIKPISMF